MATGIDWRSDHTRSGACLTAGHAQVLRNLPEFLRIRTTSSWRRFWSWTDACLRINSPTALSHGVAQLTATRFSSVGTCTRTDFGDRAYAAVARPKNIDSRTICILWQNGCRTSDSQTVIQSILTVAEDVFTLTLNHICEM